MRREFFLFLRGADGSEWIDKVVSGKAASDHPRMPAQEHYRKEKGNKGMFHGFLRPQLLYLVL